MSTREQASKKPRPYGKARSRKEVEENIAKVQEWTQQGLSQRVIRAHLAERGVKRATATRYLKVADARHTQMLREMLPQKLERRLARLSALSRKYEAEGESHAVVQLEKEINAMLGVHAPEQVEHKVAQVVAHVNVDVTKLTESELELLEAMAVRAVVAPALGEPSKP